MVINEEYKINIPKKARDAIEHYKENNDWLSYFLKGLRIKSNFLEEIM